MRLQVLSDVHFEFHADSGRSFVDSLDPTDVDVLVLAGDVGVFRDGLIPTLGRACARYPHVVFVCGNHEYYMSSPREVHTALAAFEKLTPNFHWLNRTAVTIQGQRFVGSTLWFPDDPRAVGLRRQMNDFKAIKGFVPWVFDENRKDQNFLEQTVEPGDVVVTHYLPSYQCVAPMWRMSPLNAFFVCGMDRLIDRVQPKCWVHGHSHESLDAMLGETRVVRNPFGYAGLDLNVSYQERFIVEV